MASKQLTFTIRPRGKPIRKLPEETTLTPLSTTAELYQQIAKEAKFSVHRLRITKGSDGTLVPNSASTSIDRTGLRNQSTIYVKDLGPQIAWRTVFLIEYLGPLLIHPLFYHLRLPIFSLLPSSLSGPGALPATPSLPQTLTYYLILVHFIKRELETLFVHRFSAATMPWVNVFRNSAHYWVLSGLLMAVATYGPWSSTEAAEKATLTSPLIAVGLALYTTGELGNLQSHLTLRSLRTRGGAERGIPQGPFFDLVTCPNYMFEMFSWFGVAAVALQLGWVAFAASGVFVGVSGVTLGIWARKKERRYRREFGEGYRRKRYALLPGIW